MAIASKKAVDPKELPPSERAAHFHGLRTFHQVMQWALVCNVPEPLEWGWIQNENDLAPIKTDLASAPSSLKKIIRCNCKLSNKNACNSNICSCRKHGMVCIASCGGCHGEDCNM